MQTMKFTKGRVALRGLLAIIMVGALVMATTNNGYASVGQSYADDGMAALQGWYNNTTGTWDSTGWWNSANALETVIDYTARTGQTTYSGDISNTFDKNSSGNFLNDYYDDEGWWAITWIKAYDLTGDSRYLDMAKTIFTDMAGGWDNTCNGGIWWSKDRNYKNAIANELFLVVAARLHQRTPGGSGPGSYLDWAQREWNWFNTSGMINGSNLVNDGLTADCQNNGQTTWSYNQGVILGGLVELYKSTNDVSYLNKATQIADAAISSSALVNANGILVEPCETGGCGADGPQFKGIFMKYLYYLYQNTNQASYRDFILKNARSIWANNRNSANQLGLHWAGSFDSADASRQSSAMDALNAAVQLGSVYQAENGTLHNLGTEATYAGYHGTGYLAGWNSDGQWVDLNVTVPASGNYSLILRYSGGAGNATRYIYANGAGVVSNQGFPGTGSWSNYNTIVINNVPLNSVSNTVSVIFDSSKGSTNYLNLDELTVE